MATEDNLGQENRFVHAVLPWLVAAAGLIIYLLTLNRWISLSSLPYIARATGLEWTPELTGNYGPLGPYGPLFYLVTYPVRWLPAPWVPLTLNLFSVVCAALTLALLARSVTLLPHDRTHEQRQREHSLFSLLSLRAAWIPPVFAAAVCGLQLSFWENATVASGDIFDVLLFAYIVRCLLEYRIAWQDSWLMRAALVYGAAMTGNWLLIGLFPVFIAALIWIRGISFFNLRFLGGMVLCGLAGLLLYLLFPLIYSLSDNNMISFWQALKVNLMAQKGVLQFFFLRVPKYLLLLLATTSFLPTLLMSVRWSSYFGDPSKVGIATTTGILHLAHGALLAVCIWVEFDPVFSPHHKGIVIPGLYYLCALSIGYFVGYFLLVFKPLPDRMGRIPAWRRLLHLFSQGMVWGLLLLVPAGLLCRNVPQIRMTNGPAMKQYASLLAQNLPDRGVILSDSESTRSGSASRLWLVEAWIARHGNSKNFIFLDTQSLLIPTYHDFQQKLHPDEWPRLVDSKKVKRVPDMTLVNLMMKLSENNPVYYLHPSFGYYFEFFYPQPHGLVLELRRYPTNSITRPPLTPAEIAENENFWKENRQTLEQLLPFIRAVSSPDPGFGQRLEEALYLPFEPNATAAALGRYYSPILDFWGVAMQRSGQLKKAGQHFETALALNADNVAAEHNLKCNRDLQAGRPLTVELTHSPEDDFRKYRNWQEVLRSTGPFDDPTHAFIEAISFVQGHLNRQAVQEFERVKALAKDNLQVRLWLARFYANQFPDKSLALISEIRARPEAWESASIQKSFLSLIEANALFASQKAPEAQRILQETLDENPKNERLLLQASQLSAAFGQFTNALMADERALQLSPTNVSALIASGYLNIQLGHFEQAVPPLTRVLSLDTNNFVARLDRAIAYLRGDKLDEAQRDYETLLKVEPHLYKIYYGLGEIAWRKKDTNAAIHNYELYLANSIPDSEETKIISERLENLKAAAP